MEFQLYNQKRIQKYITKREGETKLGETIQFVESVEDLKKTEAKYVLVGIPEDFGVRANYGVGGTQTAWKAFLTKFLNIQENQYQTGKNIVLLGAFNFSEEYREKKQTVEELRTTISKIDQHVFEVLMPIFKADKVPIIIGGGHNNSYPNLKAAASGLNKKINCINLDAHADYRIKEGRHSGNGFRYAKEEGFLEKYYIIGLHENYNSQSLFDALNIDINIDFTLFEEIKIQKKYTLEDVFKKAEIFTKENPIGLELDLDCIEGVLSSAMTPTGFSPNEARQFIHYFKKNTETAYLHICEGAYELESSEKSSFTGKIISYLVSDFIKKERE
ncbi:MAG: formimidoylglutamase [Flavobacteriales bacterium]